MIKKLLPYAKKYWIPSVLSPLAIAIEVILEVRIPFLIADIIDKGIKENDMNFVLMTGGKMVAMALCSLIFGALAARFSAMGGMGFGSEVRKALFYKVQDFSFANIDKFSVPSLITRMTTDVNMIQNTFMMVIRICVRSPLMLCMAVSYAVKINAELSVVFLIAAPLLAAALGTIGFFAFPRFKKVFKRYDNLNSAVQENLIAIRVVKAFVRSKYEKDKFEVSNSDLKDISIFAEKLIILSGPIMTIAMNACIIAILWFGGNLVINGSMSTGDITAFISYISQIMMSLMMFSMIFIMLVMSKASVTRITEVLSDVPDISDKDADKNLCVEDGNIEFKNVSFRYSSNAENDVLKNINVSIKSGETIGIIGGTGSAKSTLVQLIPRLYDATDGEVIIAGHNVKEYTTEVLRNNIAMVLQNNVLFSGTISENLRWGNENATQEEIETACKTAQIHDFIISLPKGYETDLNHGGVNVSGGQKQRLCIARALLKKPKVLILDDSTSAVDTATDSKIRESFEERISDTTTIIIAQRINSVEHADRIIVLDDGKINAVGTHDELIKTNDIYKEVYKSQQEGSVA